MKSSIAFHRSITLILLSAAVAGIPAEALAGAWTLERGQIYNRIAVHSYATGSEFDPSGHRRDLAFHGEFRSWSVSNYMEFGLSDRLTAVASLSVLHLRTENDIRIVTTTGLGDVDAALRMKILEGPAGVASIQALATIPSGYDETVALPLGSGEAEFAVNVLYGRSLGPLLPGYWGVEAGYRFRAGAPEDNIHYLVEFGSDLGGDFYARAKLDGTRGTKTGLTVDVNGNPTVRNSYDLGTLDVTAGRRFGRVSVEAGFAPGLYGRTTTAGSRFSLAMACSIG